MNHTPVLLQEFLDYAAPQAGDRLLDATLGLGGHAKAFLEAAPDTTVVGIDADPAALKEAQKNLADFTDRTVFMNIHFSCLSQAGGGDNQSSRYTHVLFDLGLGSHQLQDTSRGFAFESPDALSMSFGNVPDIPADFAPLNYLQRRLGHVPDAADIIGGLRQNELAELIRFYGEERFSGRIARVIKETQPGTARELAEAISRAVPGSYRHGRIHPATRTFQALRLAVNRELESLRSALPIATGLLVPRGKLIVVSFHSLEDRIVKRFFKSEPALEIITKKPVRPSETEKQSNPRSRSAKLRAAVKVGEINLKTSTLTQTYDSQYQTKRRSSSFTP